MSSPRRQIVSTLVVYLLEIFQPVLVCPASDRISKGPLSGSVYWGYAEKASMTESFNVMILLRVYDSLA